MIAPISEQMNQIQEGDYDSLLSSLYGEEEVIFQKSRYLRLLELLKSDKPDAASVFVNAPGRTELGGNHTDHNHGCVLAAAVNLDCLAAVTPTTEKEIVLHSEDYPSPLRVDLQDLTQHPDEEGTPEALVRGMAASFYKKTGKCDGFYGWISSTCKPGTGLSSSAAFSVMIGGVLNLLYNTNSLSAEELALMAQQAENHYFGKPCGLMDQMASSVGGTIFIDFNNPDEPEIKQLEKSLEGSGYQLVIVDTGGSHIELTREYASIPDEMRTAAAVLGQSSARDINLKLFLENVNKIRTQAGDRATLRLLHFIEENKRAKVMADHLRQGDFSRYLQCVEQSGLSSLSLLQNCANPVNTREQGVLLALAMSERICPRTISRVHGGGFAGTVQTYVPQKNYATYKNGMEQIFGPSSVSSVLIGRPGVIGISGSKIILPGK